MTNILSHPFSVFFRLLSSLRCVWSLRRLSLLLPAGSSAPRLDLQLILPSSTTGHVEQLRLGDTVTSDETYTTTSSSLTDFDDEGGVKLSATLTSTPTSRTSAQGKSRYWKPNDSGAFGEPSFSDQGSTTSTRIRKPQHILHPRGCSVERVHVPVYTYAGMKSATHSNNRPADVHARPYQRGGHKNVKNHAKKLLLEPAPLQGDVCKEPKRLIAPSHRYNARRNPRSSSDESSHPLPDTHRIAQLETELSRLRSQLAQLIVMQEGKHLLAGSSEEFEPRLEGDGESDVDPVGIRDIPLSQPAILDSEEIRTSSPYHPPPPPTTVSIPPPPPLPLLPSPPAPKDDWRTRLIEIRKQKYGSSPASKTEPTLPQKPADMNQVLRELQSGSIKLRSVPRSPGGTPVRTHPPEPSNETDACAIIARALKKKFCRVRAVLDLSGSWGENTHGSSLQDSTTELKQPSPTCPLTDSRLQESQKQNPPFGQHLLRPTHGNAPVDFESPCTKNSIH